MVPFTSPAPAYEISRQWNISKQQNSSITAVQKAFKCYHTSFRDISTPSTFFSSKCLALQL